MQLFALLHGEKNSANYMKKMINNIPKKLEIITNRCKINNICEKDIEDIILLYNDKLTRKYLGGILDRNIAFNKIKKMIDNQEKVYAITLKENDDFIGLLYLSKYYDDINIELSYEFLSSYWGCRLWHGMYV